MSFVNVADKTIYRFRFRFTITPPTLSSIKVLKPPKLQNLKTSETRQCMIVVRIIPFWFRLIYSIRRSPERTPHIYWLNTLQTPPFPMTQKAYRGSTFTARTFLTSSVELHVALSAKCFKWLCIKRRSSIAFTWFTEGLKILRHIHHLSDLNFDKN